MKKVDELKQAFNQALEWMDLRDDQGQNVSGDIRRMTTLLKAIKKKYAEFVAAGADIVSCLGEGLDAEAFARGDFEKIKQAAKQFLAVVQEAKKGGKSRASGQPEKGS